MWASMSILRLRLRRVVSRKFCSGASSEWEWAGRPNLILQPCVAEGKVEYNFYPPLKKGFKNCVGSGGEEELDVMKNKRNDWVGSSQGWVFMFERGGSYNMCLLNPLSVALLTWVTYLVSEEESGQLFMVRRYLGADCPGIDYKVCRITATAYHDDVIVYPCESLDGLVMFIGKNHCFAVKGSYPEFKPNAIYFCSGDWPVENQRADTFFYDHTKPYSAGFNFSPDHSFLFRSNRPPMFFNSGGLSLK
ncbi:hypothetical protein OROGR_012119 [Orobanche gracilis]